MDCEREINVYNYVTGAPKVAETCGLKPCSACGKGMQGQWGVNIIIGAIKEQWVI